MTDAIDRLRSIVDQLRAPGGCPWDRAQTSSSLKTYLLEEAHEVAEAIDRGNPDELCGELGDLLLNVFLQARIAAEQSTFDLDDVANRISDKLVRRHPHVFGEAEAETEQEVRQLWEQAKREEAAEQSANGAPHAKQHESVLRDLPTTMPLLLQAERVGKMAAEVGFDWPTLAGPMAKLREELAEIEEAVRGGDQAAVESEIGDLLFATVSLCRHTKVDPEKALRGCLGRFRQRFRHMEHALGEELGQTSLDRLEQAWERSKRVNPDS